MRSIIRFGVAVCLPWLASSGCSLVPSVDPSGTKIFLTFDEVSIPDYFELNQALKLTNFIRSDRVGSQDWVPLLDQSNARWMLRTCPDGILLLYYGSQSAEFTEGGFVVRDFACFEPTPRQARALQHIPPDRFHDDWLLSPETYQEHVDLGAGPADKEVSGTAEPPRSLADPWFHALALRRCGTIDYHTRDHVWTARGWIAAQIRCHPPILASAPDEDMRPKLWRQPTYVCRRQPGVTCEPVKRY